MWFEWTAPYAGNVTFDTIGSVDVTFSTMDTVLAVYTGNNLASLNSQGANDNVSTLNKNSSVTFTATGGQTYHIGIYVNTGAGGHPGNYILNWSEQGAPSAGQFRMTSANYTYSMNDGNTRIVDSRGGNNKEIGHYSPVPLSPG